ncbi:MAG: DJ-1/PfpI family protein [Thermomicrobiales bacterium]
MVNPRTVGILVFPEVEVLDFCGPFEVFASAGGEGNRLFAVSVVGETTDIVTCRGGLWSSRTSACSDSPRFDLIVVPGGLEPGPNSTTPG